MRWFTGDAQAEVSAVYMKFKIIQLKQMDKSRTAAGVLLSKVRWGAE